jgi:hypothetical protein
MTNPVMKQTKDLTEAKALFSERVNEFLNDFMLYDILLNHYGREIHRHSKDGNNLKALIKRLEANLLKVKTTLIKIKNTLE